jgi:hypothetical protein
MLDLLVHAAFSTNVSGLAMTVHSLTRVKGMFGGSPGWPMSAPSPCQGSFKTAELGREVAAVHKHKKAEVGRVVLDIGVLTINADVVACSAHILATATDTRMTSVTTAAISASPGMHA